jgi:hypothetical protein
VREIALLVEARLIQTEAVDDINDLLRAIFESLLAFLSRRVGANVDVVVANGDFLAVSFVGDAINLLEVVGVGDDLVIGDEVLFLLHEAERYHQIHVLSQMQDWNVGFPCLPCR